MRDQVILGRFEMLSDAMSSDITRLQRGLSLVKTRQDAFERLILGNRFGLLRMALFQVIAPSLVAKLMQEAHANEIELFEAVRKVASQKKGPIMTPPKVPLVVA